MLKTKQADGLLIAKLDRLTRSVSDWQILIDGYFGEKAGKSLFSVADSIDTRSSAGRLVLNVLLSVAQWDGKLLANGRATLCSTKSRRISDAEQFHLASRWRQMGSC